MINPTELLFRFEPASVFHLWNPHTRQYNRDLSNYKTILGDRVIRSGKMFQ